MESEKPRLLCSSSSFSLPKKIYFSCLINLNHESKHFLTLVSKYLLHVYKQTQTLLDEALNFIFGLKLSPGSN